MHLEYGLAREWCISKSRGFGVPAGYFAPSCCLITVGIVHDGTRPLLAGVARHVSSRDGSGGWGPPFQAVGV